MKVPAARVRAFASRPDPKAAGVLIYGDDALEVDSLRLRLSQALLAAAGEGSEITRMTADEARRDPASLTDALRSGGLFGGRPVVLVDGAADGSAEAMRIATEGLRPDEGALIVTGGKLNARSKLRKLFEDAPNLAALACYPKALDAEGVASLLAEAGDPRLSPEAMETLVAFAAIAEAAEVRGVASTLALYALGQTAPLTPEEVEALLPRRWRERPKPWRTPRWPAARPRRWPPMPAPPARPARPAPSPWRWGGPSASSTPSPRRRTGRRPRWAGCARPSSGPAATRWPAPHASGAARSSKRR